MPAGSRRRVGAFLLLLVVVVPAIMAGFPTRGQTSQAVSQSPASPRVFAAAADSVAWWDSLRMRDLPLSSEVIERVLRAWFADLRLAETLPYSGWVVSASFEPIDLGTRMRVDLLDKERIAGRELHLSGPEAPLIRDPSAYALFWAAVDSLVGMERGSVPASSPGSSR